MELNTDLILGKAHKLHNNTNKPIKECIIEALHNAYDTHTIGTVCTFFQMSEQDYIEILLNKF